MVRTIIIDPQSRKPAREQPQRIDPLRLHVPCRHRGEQIATGHCRPCQAIIGQTEVPVFACPLHEQCVTHALKAVIEIDGDVEEITTSCAKCGDYKAVTVTAPFWGLDGSPAWQGIVQPKPWTFPVTAAIPHLDTPEELALVVELLQLQTVKPYIMIVDTGSTPENFAQVESLRDDNVEVHSLRFNAVQHASDLPAIAMDFALSAARSEWLFCTHSDVFPRRRDLIETLLAQVGRVPRRREKPDHEDWGLLAPVDIEGACAIGYRMTERLHRDWERMVSHTCTLLHIPTMDKIGAGWSLRRLCNRHGVPERQGDMRPGNWPDTEVLINYILWRHGLTPENGRVILIDGEVNHERTCDENIDHCRSLTCGRLYASAEYVAKVDGWVVDALEQGRQRVEEWRRESLVNSASE